MRPLCHCGLQPATVPATVAGVPIVLCPACVAHYRAQRWADGRPIEVVVRGGVRVKALASGIDRMATAIRSAAEEHGRPNTFALVELWALGGPTPMTAGRLLRRAMPEIWHRLGGHDAWGSCPRYEHGRVAV